LAVSVQAEANDRHWKAARCPGLNCLLILASTVFAGFLVFYTAALESFRHT